MNKKLPMLVVSSKHKFSINEGVYIQEQVEQGRSLKHLGSLQRLRGLPYSPRKAHKRSLQLAYRRRCLTLSKRIRQELPVLDSHISIGTTTLKKVDGPHLRKHYFKLFASNPPNTISERTLNPEEVIKGEALDKIKGDTVEKIKGQAIERIKGEYMSQTISANYKAKAERTRVKVKASWHKRLFNLEVQRAEINKLLACYLSFSQVIIASKHYKVYAEEGNNGYLIARILKEKGYWTIVNDPKLANLVWTQQPIVTANLVNAKSYKCIQSPAEPIAFTKQFLKHKQNDFTKTVRQLFTQTMFNKYIAQLAVRFKNGDNVSAYAKIQRYYQSNRNVRDIKNVKRSINAIQYTLFNHMANGFELGDKQRMFCNLQMYCNNSGEEILKMIPRTELIGSMSSMEQSRKVLQGMCMPLIVKPGEQSNRGRGISVHWDVESAAQAVAGRGTFVVQHCLEPLLYEGRKFDLRVWLLYSQGKVWFYREGYVRTCSRPYHHHSTDRFVQLTNDAVQRGCTQYGRHQPANKLSFAELDKYLKDKYHYPFFFQTVWTRIRDISAKLFTVGVQKLVSCQNSFQLFGIDFLMDTNLNVWLIQCNTNPCLEINCSLLSRLIPNMIHNLITLVVDPYFPPPPKKNKEQPWLNQRFNFQLLLDCDEEIQLEQNKQKLTGQNNMNSYSSMNQDKNLLNKELEINNCFQYI